jgi:putative ABC transport system permease protein
VVAHVKTEGLDSESPGQIYVSSAQYPWRWQTVLLRSEGDPMLLLPAATRAVHDMDPNQPVTSVATMDQIVSAQLRDRKFVLTVLSAFAAVAIVLAAIGLYGVIAYGVTQRRREFAVRLALGARRMDIARMIALEGGRIALIGLGIGLAATFAIGRAVVSLLFGVGPHDVTAVGAASIALAAVAAVACVIPARRASAVAPAETLREA